MNDLPSCPSLGPSLLSATPTGPHPDHSITPGPIKITPFKRRHATERNALNQASKKFSSIVARPYYLIHFFIVGPRYQPDILKFSVPICLTLKTFLRDSCGSGPAVGSGLRGTCPCLNGMASLRRSLRFYRTNTKAPPPPRTSPSKSPSFFADF